MLIDWFTVGAQVINFLVLVWLLRRFLYQPVLHAIDERERRIAAQLAEADAKKAEAKKERDDFRHRNEELEGQREALLAKALAEAGTERQRLLDEARREFDSLRVQRQEALKKEQQGLGREITARTRQEVFAIARKTLTDLAATSLEERMTEVFIRGLRDLNGSDKARLTAALKASPSSILVRSTFDLPQIQRTAIEDAIKETIAAQTQVRFEAAPELISGIELTTNGHRVAWSIADYLTSLEKSLGKLLEEKSQPFTPTLTQGGGAERL